MYIFTFQIAIKKVVTLIAQQSWTEYTKLVSFLNSLKRFDLYDILCFKALVPVTVGSNDKKNLIHMTTTPENVPTGPLRNCKIGTELKI